MKPPAYIDYEEEENEPKETWTHKKLQWYWWKKYTKYHKGSADRWTLKEISLLSRMITMYTSSEIAEMMRYWMKTQPTSRAHNFSYFYTNRKDIYNETAKERENFSWD